MADHEQAVTEVLDAGRLLSTAVVMFHTAIADAAGLSVTESKALEILERLGPLTPSDLARESALAPASVTALVDRLTRKGVARRVPHPGDARRVLVEIDPGHLARSDALFTRFVAAMRELCADYDADQLQLVAGFVTAAARVQLDAAADLPTA